MARVVYNHEPEPAGRGILYGGAEVEVGIEADAGRSMVCAVVVFVGEGELARRWGLWVEGGRRETGTISRVKSKCRIVPPLANFIGGIPITRYPLPVLTRAPPDNQSH